MNDEHLAPRGDDEVVPAELVGPPALPPEVTVPSSPVEEQIVLVLPGPRKPPVWPIFLVLVLSLFVQVMGLGLTGLWAVVRNPGALRSPAEFQFALRETLESPGSILLSAGATMVGFAVLAVGATWLGGERVRDRLRLFRPQATPGLLLLALLGVLNLQLCFVAASQLEYLPESELLQEIFHKINLMGPGGQLAAILVIGVAPGICEEALFRGYVQTGFTRRWGPWRGALITGVLFGLMHLNMVQGLFATLLGLYLGLLTERTASIIPAIILHSVNNVVATVLAIGNWEPVLPRAEIVLAGAFTIVIVTQYIVAYPILNSARGAAGRAETISGHPFSE